MFGRKDIFNNTTVTALQPPGHYADIAIQKGHVGEERSLHY